LRPVEGREIRSFAQPLQCSRYLFPPGFRSPPPVSGSPLRILSSRARPPNLVDDQAGGVERVHVYRHGPHAIQVEYRRPRLPPLKLGSDPPDLIPHLTAVLPQALREEDVELWTRFKLLRYLAERANDLAHKQDLYGGASPLAITPPVRQAAHYELDPRPVTPNASLHGFHLDLFEPPDDLVQRGDSALEY